MKTEFLKLILAEIDVILSKEQKVSVQDILSRIDYPNDQILIAIGYLLHDNRVYLNEKDMALEYKEFYF